MDFEAVMRLVLCQIQFMFGTYYANLFNTHLFQDFFDDVLNRRGGFMYKFRHCLFIVVATVFTLRCWDYDMHLDFDRISKEAHGNFMLFIINFVGEQFMLKIAMTFLVFVIIVEVFMFFTQVDCDVWQMYNDLILRNMQYYNEASQKVSHMEKLEIVRQGAIRICQMYGLPNSYSELGLVRICSKFLAYRNFDLIDQRHYRQCPFYSLFLCSYSVRKKTVLLLRTLEYLTMLTGCFIFGVAYVVSMHFIRVNEYRGGYKIMPEVFSVNFVKFCVDGVTIFILIIKVYQAGSYLFFFSISSTMAYSEICKDAQRSLLKAIKLAEKKDKTVSDNENENADQFRSKKVVKSVWKFLRVHTNICRVMSLQNHSTWNRMIFFSFIIMFISNCFYMTRLVLKRIDGFRLTILLIIISLQTGVMASTLLPLGAAHKSFHMAKKILPKALRTIESGNNQTILRIKLKLLLTYERLTHGPKYGTKIGVIGTVTYRLLFKIVFVYIAYFLTFLNTMV